ncbi:unnamed protein product [Caenorhabditis brenneri]
MPGTFQLFIQDDALFITTNSNNLTASMIMLAWISVAYFFILLGAGVAGVFYISSKVRRIPNSSDKNVGKKLAKITFTYCVVYLGILLWSTVFGLNSYFKFFPAIDPEIHIVCLAFSSDMMTLSLPYILLIFDGNVGRSLCRKKVSTVNVKPFVQGIAT